MGDQWQNTILITDIKGEQYKCKNNRLFVQGNSLPMFLDSVTQWTSKFVEKYNLPDFTSHSLRHTNVTLQIAAGVPLRMIAARAGHKQTSIILNIYSHVLKSADEEAAQAISKTINLSELKTVN